MVFDAISSNIDEVLSVNPSANVFVFGDFSVNHKYWLTYSGGTERPYELCYNFSILNNLTQMINFATWIPDCDCCSPTLLDFCLSSDPNICSYYCVFPSNNILSMLLSLSPLTFLQTQKGMALFIIWPMTILVLTQAVLGII